MYFQACAPDRRWAKQAIGPRTPVSWLEDIKNVKMDDVADFEDRVWSDLKLSEDSAAKELEEPFCQPRSCGINMGDISGVAMRALMMWGF